jgi:hypothetical protein
MSSDDRTLEDELGRRLRRRPEIRFALLFGSRASGRHHAQSDLDVAVYVDPALTAREAFDLRLELGAELSELGEPDVTVLNDAPPLLAHRALMGTRLFIRDQQDWVRFFMKTFRESEDERYYRRLHESERSRRLEEGSFGRP